MGDADEFRLLAERYESLLVLKPNHARGPEARRGDAHELIEKDAVLRVGPAFRHELKAMSRTPPVWYHDTTRECQSIEAPQWWADCARSVAEYLLVLDDAAFGGATPVKPNAISPTDLAARYTAGQLHRRLCHSDNYLIDLKHAVIMDVEVTTAIR
jgi:hypothetical protein